MIPMKRHISYFAAALVLCAALAGCGGGGDSGSGGSGSAGTLAQGSDPLVNGSSSSSGIVQEEEEQLHMMTIEETIDYFNSLDPKTLGLEGESMEEYHIYPSEKAIPVDGLPCMKIIVYAKSEAGTNSPEDTFLVARDGTAIYRLMDDEKAEKLDIG